MRIEGFSARCKRRRQAAQIGRCARLRRSSSVFRTQKRQTRLEQPVSLALNGRSRLPMKPMFSSAQRGSQIIGLARVVDCRRAQSH